MSKKTHSQGSNSDFWEDFPLRKGDYATGHPLNNETDDDDQCVTTKTHGCIWRDPLVVTMFGTFMVLFILLPISPTSDSTLGGKFSGFIENLLERNEESNKRVIGSGITDLVTN